MLSAVPTDEAHALPVLVGEHPPTVHLLLEDPAGAVEGLADERGGHGDVLRNHEAGFYRDAPLVDGH